MPAHKRSSPDNHEDEDPVQNHHAKQPRDAPEFEGGEAEPEDLQDLQRHQGEDEVEEEDSESNSGSTSPSSDEKPEFISVELSNIRKDVQCPICLGIIKKTRTVMECLHRFCRECIDKSMRLGNNECPACRTHCASRRSLRDDPNYDALIGALYPDIDKYEEQELAFHDEERNRNKQIQAAIAEISQRQTEALARRRALGKDAAGSYLARPQRNHQNAHSRRRRNSRDAELLRYENNDDEHDNNEGKGSSSTDERSTTLYQQHYKRRRPRTRPPQSSSSAANSDGGCLENDLDSSREMLVWGKGGARSHTRNGISSGSNHRNTQNNRLSKLVGYLRSLEENKEEV